TKIIATASVGGKTVTKDVNNFGKITLGGKPKLWVSLEPFDERATNHLDPTAKVEPHPEGPLSPSEGERVGVRGQPNAVPNTNLASRSEGSQPKKRSAELQLGATQALDRAEPELGAASSEEARAAVRGQSNSIPHASLAQSNPPITLTIAPGERLPAWLKIKRNGHEDLVTFFVEDLPHGVIVDDIGLNGVLIPKGENERKI